MVDRACYSFKLSAWNELAGVDDFYSLFYYIRNDGVPEIEIFNLKNKRKFLARIEYRNLRLDDVRPGCRIVIFGKQYKVEDYEDSRTRETLGIAQASFVFVINHEGFQHVGHVWSTMDNLGLSIVNAKMYQLSPEDADHVSRVLDHPLPPPIVDTVSSNPTANTLSSTLRDPSLTSRLSETVEVECVPVIALEVMGQDVPNKAKELFQQCKDVIHMPVDDRVILQLKSELLGSLRDRLSSAKHYAATYQNCSVILILSHLIAQKKGGDCLTILLHELRQRNLRVTGLRTVEFTRTQAEEFLEVYKGVVPDYIDIINEYSKGTMIALEVSGPEDIVHIVREIAGPREVDVAQRIRPNSIRASFAGGRGELGVHVTDLPDDGPLESEYIFSLLDRA